MKFYAIFLMPSFPPLIKGLPDFLSIANKSKVLQRDLSKLIRGLNTHQTKTSIYRRGIIIDNDLDRIFFLKRQYGAGRRDRVTRKILKSKEGIPENFLEASS